MVLLRRQDATDRNIDTPHAFETQVNTKRPSREELKMATNRVFAGEWENIPDSLFRQLKGVLPGNIEKNVCMVQLEEKSITFAAP